ncbi:calcineurin-like phosphoesterase C-terminal domain-containing protein [Ornithinicoccus halotolerans]|uniref:calcineurin-like phosphoesterase C-terminal domain-containing protein n=1 Tax=Ornithinicoccus halotolerans TaxID=1748220 RepID=UPI001297BDA6|nr:calcineurin-like phosphoesterase family protein [Ornithinicoccus halotolerans]
MTRSTRSVRLTTGALVLSCSAALLAPAISSAAPADSAPPAPTSPGTDWDEAAYRGSVDVVEGPDGDQETVDGTVFVDQDHDSVQDADERGLGGVTVANGRDVTTTDSHGRYQLPAYDNMTVTVTQPRGYQVPVDEHNVAQFHYHHLPEGSPELRYGGIAPTGPLPDEVNFPLARSRSTQSPEQHCAIGADVQTYNLDQVEYARNGVFTDLAERSDYAGCGALFIGDVVGDDLSLFSQTRELTSMLNGPARFLPGNHDLDFDSSAREHNFDTFRAQLGPEYFSYDSGKAHVVALSSIEYPTTRPPSKGDYTYGLGERQLEWLRNDIAAVPENRLIVLASHSPLLEFWYSDSHRTKQLQEIYQILEGREVVAVSGHTHMSENLREGDLMAGWTGLVGEEGLPFPHLTVGAVSGHWYAGRLLEEGYPTAVQRDGTPPGVLTLDIKNTEVTERYTVRGADESRQLALGLNSPRYRDWFEANESDAGSAPQFQDPLAVGQDALSGTWLTTNFWMGSTGSTVEVSIDGGEPVAAERTQPMEGEAVRVGAEWSDPVANQETLPHGGGVVDRTMHLWRLPLPADLAVGEHTAEVTATDVHGRTYTETLTFEVTE